MSGPRPSASRTPSLRSASTDPSSTTDAQRVALIGALQAFARPRPGAPALVQPTGSDARRQNGAPRPPAAHASTGVRERSPHSDNGSVDGSLNTKNKTRTGDMARAYVQSPAPSSVAPPATMTATAKRATPVVAVSEAAPQSEAVPWTQSREGASKPPVAPKPRRLSEYSGSSETPEVLSSTDDSPILPTASLVGMFERRSTSDGKNMAQQRPQSMAVAGNGTVRSPKPLRTRSGGITSVFRMELEEANKSSKLSPNATGWSGKAGAPYDGHSSGDEYFSASEDTATQASPLTMRKRDSRALSITSTSTADVVSPALSTLNPTPSSAPSFAKPIAIPPSARPAPASSSGMSISSQSGQSIQAQYHQRYPRKTTPLHTGDDLANAIVASSLASSRAPSPHKLEPPPPPVRRRHLHKLSHSRTPSPAKHGMLHTLRKQEPEELQSEDEEHPYGKHRKRRIVRKHPNKHHEGDRKRWRDAVTERERKRYEGVWAANKGLYYSFTSEEMQEFSLPRNAELANLKRTGALEQVSSIVARDIWSRSRLPEDTLEMVWDLVDNDAVGRLSKEEFVVGMWLIDQRLKGRKLPVKVSETVWASVRGLQGIKIRK